MHYNLHIKILINKIYFWLKILQTNKYNADDTVSISLHNPCSINITQHNIYVSNILLLLHGPCRSLPCPYRQLTSLSSS